MSGSQEQQQISKTGVRPKTGTAAAKTGAIGKSGAYSGANVDPKDQFSNLAINTRGPAEGLNSVSDIHIQQFDERNKENPGIKNLHPRSALAPLIKQLQKDFGDLNQHIITTTSSLYRLNYSLNFNPQTDVILDQ